MDWRGIKTFPDLWNLQPIPRKVWKKGLCTELISIEREKLSRVGNSSLKRSPQISGDAPGPCTPDFPPLYPSAQNPLDIYSIKRVVVALWRTPDARDILNSLRELSKSWSEEGGNCGGVRGSSPEQYKFYVLTRLPGSSGRARGIKHLLNLSIVPSQSTSFMTSDKRGSFIAMVLEVNCLFWSDLSLFQLSYCESHQISKGGIKNNSFPDPCKYQLSPRSHNELKVGRGRHHKLLLTQRQEVINDLHVLWNLSGFS